jgi:hypothetical protein
LLLRWLLLGFGAAFGVRFEREGAGEGLVELAELAAKATFLSWGKDKARIGNLL